MRVNVTSSSSMASFYCLLCVLTSSSYFMAAFILISLVLCVCERTRNYLFFNISMQLHCWGILGFVMGLISYAMDIGIQTCLNGMNERTHQFTKLRSYTDPHFQSQNSENVDV